MTTLTGHTATRPQRHEPVFPSVLCGIGPGTPSLEAARQATVIAAGGRLTLAAIGTAEGVGPERAQLAGAFVLAGRDADAPGVVEIPVDAVLPSLLLLAGRHDLLVIGAHDALSGRDDITHAIIHQSPAPVLVARPAPPGTAFLDRILVAGADEAATATATAAALAGRHGSAIETLSADAETSDAPDGAIARRDRAVEAVLAAADRFGATVIVLASRGLSGVAGLASVSAAVAERADCSVLVVPPAWS